MQIENEYGPESKELGAAGQAYINWAAKMAVGLDTGVPWVMCKEDDAPDPVVNGLILFADSANQIFYSFTSLYRRSWQASYIIFHCFYSTSLLRSYSYLKVDSAKFP